MDKDEPTSLDSVVTRISQLEGALKEIRSLLGTSCISYPDGTVLVQTIHGNKFFIDPFDLVMAPQLIVYRQWEEDISRYMINSCDPDTVFVDVGANFGYFTVMNASRIGNAGNGIVICVEPNQKMISLLKKNIRINWSLSPIKVHEFAVSDTVGHAYLSIPDSAANARILATAAASESPTKVIVETKPIDSFTEDRQIDIMKIDVEGFELLALRGARKTIARSPKINIVLEWSVGQMQALNIRPEDLISEFHQQGLASYQLPHTRHLAENQWQDLLLTDDQLLKTDYRNFVLRHSQGQN